MRGRPRKAIVDGTKECCVCALYKPLSDFHNDKSKISGRQSRCKNCDRKAGLALRYGLRIEEYDDLMTSQGRRCAICANVPIKPLAVDHCHITGNVRGLLCQSCNLLLGHAKDDPKILQHAAEYLVATNKAKGP